MSAINFILLKINGYQIKDLTIQKVLKLFLNSEAPLQIEITRDSNAEKLEGCDRGMGSLSKQLSDLSVVSSNEQLDESKLQTLQRNGFPLAINLHTVTTATPKTCTATQTEVPRFDEAEDEEMKAKEDNERVIEEEHVLFESALLAPEIDLEEITLRKFDSNENLGLTVCYTADEYLNNDSEACLDESRTCTEVYISEIQPDSVAGRDGRLRQGDQILQINGKDVKSKEETESLIAENNNAVTFLVSRYIYVDEDDFNDPASAVALEIEENTFGAEEIVEGEIYDEDEDFYVESHLPYENCMLVNKHPDLSAELNKNLMPVEAQANNSTKQFTEAASPRVMVDANSFPLTPQKPLTTQAADIFVAKSQNNEINAKSRTLGYQSPAQIGEKQHLRLLNQKNYIRQLRNDAVVNDSDTEHIYETIPEDSESEPFYCSPYESSTSLSVAENNAVHSNTTHWKQHQKQKVAQWLGLRSKTLATGIINFNRQENMRNSYCSKMTDTIKSSLTTITSESSSSGGLNGTNLIVLQADEFDNNSSSAYNTGGSNTSSNQTTVLKNEKLCESAGLSTETIALTNGNCFDSTKGATMVKKIIPNDDSTAAGSLMRIYPPEQQQQQPKFIYSSESKSLRKLQQQRRCMKQQTSLNSLQSPQFVETRLPQFTAPNLSQYHFVSSQEIVPSVASSPAAKIHMEQKPIMVWKVKKRPDGTRYIVRRPASNTTSSGVFANKNRVFRERALREQVHNDTTTEDDAMSEIKIGRFWTKEERKKHFERARERRQQQQQQQLVQRSQLNSDNLYLEADKGLVKHQQTRHSSRKRNSQQNALKIQYLHFGGVNSTSMPSRNMMAGAGVLAANTNAVPQATTNICASNHVDSPCFAAVPSNDAQESPEFFLTSIKSVDNCESNNILTAPSV